MRRPTRCELVRADYESLPAVATIDAALAEDAPRLHADHERNVLFERRHRHGDVERAFAAASVVVKETFHHARLSASPLEPRGVIARWEGRALTVWTGTQVPHIVRAALAQAFGLAERQVRVIVPDTGGGFGQKMHVMPEDLAVAVAARLINRPVKWTETRRENLASASQAREARVDIEAAADARGVLLGLRARIWSDAGSQHIYPLTASLEPMGTATILPGPYRTPAYAYDVLAVATNKPPLGAYRGVGMTMGVFVMERALDLCADRLGLDPAEIRRRNLISRDDYPFSVRGGLRLRQRRLSDGPRDGARPGRLRAPRPGARRRAPARPAPRRGHRVLHGVHGDRRRDLSRRGAWCTCRAHEAATVSMAADGSVDVHVSFPSQGQGHATTAAQIVADRLGVPIESVRVLQPDTETAPPGTGTFASRGAIAQGGAVDGAAKTVRAALVAIAAAALEASPADLELTGGRVSVRGVPGRGLSVADLARIAHSAAPGARPDARALEATEVFDPPGPTFSGAVHVASVEVDPETGRVTVRAYALVEDCGPVINPLIVEGQIHGAVAQGIGEALDERLVYDEDGQLLTGTLMDYALPVASALPDFAVGHLETPSPLTPGGYKGMGEGGTIGAPAAIANAVADAVRPLGIAITALPILPEALRRGAAAR